MGARAGSGSVRWAGGTGGYLHNLCTAAAHRGVDPFRAHQIASRQRRAGETLDKRQESVEQQKRETQIQPCLASEYARKPAPSPSPSPSPSPHTHGTIRHVHARIVTVDISTAPDCALVDVLSFTPTSLSCTEKHRARRARESERGESDEEEDADTKDGEREEEDETEDVEDEEEDGDEEEEEEAGGEEEEGGRNGASEMVINR